MALPALLLVIGLAVSGSRAGVLAAVALGVVVWRTGPQRAPDSPHRLRIGVGLAALAVLMGAGVPRSTVDPAGTRFTEAAARADQRPILWRGAIAVFADAPLAGANHGRFAGRFFEIAPDLPAPRLDVMTTHAHNAILQIAAEYGLAGLAILLLGAIAWGGLASGTRLLASARGRVGW